MTDVLKMNTKTGAEKRFIGAECKSTVETATQEHSLTMLQNIPRGRPKSGRVWKSTKSTRFSAFKLDKTQKSSWAKKMKLRAERKSINNFEDRLKTERTRKLQEKRQRQEENKTRRLENERKAEVVQSVKNTAKFRRMKKKQLKNIVKR